MRKRPLLWFACVFLSGLAFQRYKIPWLLCVVILFIGQEIYFGFKHKQMINMAGRSLILLSAFLLGMTHMWTEEQFRNTYMSQLEDGNEVTIWGEIIKIETTDYGVRMILSDSYISLNEENTPCNDIMVYASSDHFHVGEIHKIKGQFHSFAVARNQGNFDSKVFYQSQKIDFSVWMESNVLLGQEDSRITNFLLVLKERMEKVFCDCMTEKGAGFYSAMVLGDKTNLDEVLKDLFTLGGISHILAISGLHVSIIGRGCYSQLRKRCMGFFGAGLLAGVLLLGYCYMVGSSMSTVRAVGMMLIFFLGQWLGCSYDMLNALGAMCLFLLWDNPFMLEYSGFWFSVMALIGVGFVGNTLSEVFGDREGMDATSEKTKWNLKSLGLSPEIFKGIGMSLGITLATLPVTACCYYEIPLYSPLVNWVALPILTPIFCLALLGGIIGIRLPWLAKIVLVPCEWLLSFYEWICQLVEGLPFASIICGEPKPWVVVVYYGVLAGGVIVLNRWQVARREDSKNKRKTKEVINARSSKNRRCFVKIRDSLHKERILVLLISVVCLLLVIYPKEKPCEITFLDVGQGDGIYISTGDGTTYFIDGGSTSEDSVGEYRILPFLKSKGVTSIDYWFVSHADSDHISGLLEVLESRYDVEHLVVSKYAPQDENLDRLLATANVYDVDIIYMNAGDKIVSSNTSMTCLYPWDNAPTDRNDASLVLEMEISTENTDLIDNAFSWFGSKEDLTTYKIFLAGDISSEVEEVLLDKRSIEDVWLYKASHHGSKYSNSEALLEVLQPEVSVISCGKNNLYGHPHEETIENLENINSEIYYTMENGQVTFLLLQ